MGENGFFGKTFFLLPPPPPPQLRGSIHLSSSTAQKPNFFVLSSLFNFFRAHVIRQILSEREKPFPFLTGLLLTHLVHTTFGEKGGFEVGFTSCPTAMQIAVFGWGKLNEGGMK